MAEGIFLKLIEERGVAHRFEVDSAGTAGYHAGELADRRTLAVLEEHDAPMPGRSRRVVTSDFERFDYLMAMDRSNFANLENACPDNPRARLVMALETTTGGEVPDPYYGGPGGFDRVYTLLLDALGPWLDRMLDHGS